MRPVSDRWKESVRGGAVNWVTVVEWANDGGHEWQPATFVDGSVTCSATSQIRWQTGDLVVADVPYGRFGVVPWSTRFRIRHGIRYGRGATELLGMGVYRCTEVQRQRNTGRLTLSGSSFEHYLISPWGDFGITRQFRPSNARDLLEGLIREVLPQASIAWRGIDGWAAGTPQLTTDGDRWSIIDGRTKDESIARALSARVYCDGNGVWIVAPRATLEDPAEWHFRAGEAQLDADESLSLDGLFNVVKVSSQSTDGSSQVGPVTVADVDPYSPTNILKSPDEGGIGQSVLAYESDQIRWEWQAVQVGRSLLANSRGLQQTLNVSSLHNPALTPDTVVTVETDDGDVKSIIDSLTYDLKGGPMSGIQVRTTSTRFSGQAAELFDPDDQGGA